MCICAHAYVSCMYVCMYVNLCIPDGDGITYVLLIYICIQRTNMHRMSKFD
jgi:hypothetical protein